MSGTSFFGIALRHAQHERVVTGRVLLGGKIHVHEAELLHVLFARRFVSRPRRDADNC